MPRAGAFAVQPCCLLLPLEERGGNKGAPRNLERKALQLHQTRVHGADARQLQALHRRLRACRGGQKAHTYGPQLLLAQPVRLRRTRQSERKAALFHRPRLHNSGAERARHLHVGRGIRKPAAAPFQRPANRRSHRYLRHHRLAARQYPKQWTCGHLRGVLPRILRHHGGVLRPSGPQAGEPAGPRNRLVEGRRCSPQRRTHAGRHVRLRRILLPAKGQPRSGRSRPGGFSAGRRRSVRVRPRQEHALRFPQFRGFAGVLQAHQGASRLRLFLAGTEPAAASAGPAARNDGGGRLVRRRRRLRPLGNVQSCCRRN